MAFANCIGNALSRMQNLQEKQRTYGTGSLQSAGVASFKLVTLPESHASCPKYSADLTAQAQLRHAG
jgi:hypothetical protein